MSNAVAARANGGQQNTNLQTSYGFTPTPYTGTVTARLQAMIPQPAAVTAPPAAASAPAVPASSPKHGVLGYVDGVMAAVGFGATVGALALAGQAIGSHAYWASNVVPDAAVGFNLGMLAGLGAATWQVCGHARNYANKTLQYTRSGAEYLTAVVAPSVLAGTLAMNMTTNRVGVIAMILAVAGTSLGLQIYHGDKRSI